MNCKKKISLTAFIIWTMVLCIQIHHTGASPTEPLPTATHLNSEQMVVCTLKMMDAGSNGWNGTILTNQNDLGVFYGSEFTSGAAYSAPIVLQKTENIIAILQPGTASSEMGFSIEGPDGKVLCQRSPGYPAISGQVQCRISFTQNYPLLTYTYKLSNIEEEEQEESPSTGFIMLALRYNGVVREIPTASGVTQGHIAIDLPQGISVELVVTINHGLDATNIGYQIIDDFNETVLNVSEPHANWQTGQVLAYFVTAFHEEQSNNDNDDNGGTSQNQQNCNKERSAVIILTVVLVVFVIAVTICGFRRQRPLKVLKKEMTNPGSLQSLGSASNFDSVSSRK